jgi:hypothetical protein
LANDRDATNYVTGEYPRVDGCQTGQGVFSQLELGTVVVFVEGIGGKVAYEAFETGDCVVDVGEELGAVVFAEQLLRGCFDFGPVVPEKRV